MIQVYTGEGKGKTTAALGLALRACGADLRVFIGQFMKKGRYAELKSLKKFKNLKVEQFGDRCLVRKKPEKKDMLLAKAGLQRIRDVILSKKYDLIILDEINVALKFKLLELNDVLKIIRLAPRETEVILTGRYAPSKILKIADLVSEIKEKKHYFKDGLGARKGIEL